MIKLSIVDTKYQTDNKTYTKCILKWKLNCNNKTFSEIFTAHGIAHLASNDKFDYELGCKIALAKAERTAYKLSAQVFDEQIKFITDRLTDLQNFYDKACKIIEHNSEYIHNIANKDVNTD